MPRFGKQRAEQHNHIGHTVSSHIQAVRRVADHLLNKHVVARICDPPEHAGRDQRHGVTQHFAQQLPVKMRQPQIAVQPGRQKQKQRRAKIRRRGGQHIPGNAPVKARDKQHDKKQVQYCI
ncbi:hypothetical protein SDC9_147803 [bioreactor metagenome]|uniref:Uncharacterized protein n=1 Tax=bioreactor metagenome TaxID=1076179 RepID=A0A645EFT2_9ZZZZ